MSTIHTVYKECYQAIWIHYVYIYIVYITIIFITFSVIFKLRSPLMTCWMESGNYPKMEMDYQFITTYGLIGGTASFL